MIGSLLAAFFIELVKKLAEYTVKAFFTVKRQANKIHKLKPFNRRKDGRPPDVI